MAEQPDVVALITRRVLSSRFLFNIGYRFIINLHAKKNMTLKIDAAQGLFKE